MKTQHLMTWATKSGDLNCSFGGILKRFFFVRYKIVAFVGFKLVSLLHTLFTEYVFNHLYHCGFHAEGLHCGHFVEVGIKQNWNISKSGIWTQASMIVKQCVTNRATESGVLESVLDLSMIQRKRATIILGFDLRLSCIKSNLLTTEQQWFGVFKGYFS